MSILSGHKRFERYLLTNEGYILCSEKTFADSVVFKNGATLEENLGNVKGITDSLNEVSSDKALSAKAGNVLNNSIENIKNSLGDQITIRVEGTTCYIEMK